MAIMQQDRDKFIRVGEKGRMGRTVATSAFALPLVSEGVVLFLTCRIYQYGTVTSIKFKQNSYSNRIKNKRLISKVETKLTNPKLQNLRWPPRRATPIR